MGGSDARRRLWAFSSHLRCPSAPAPTPTTGPAAAGSSAPVNVLLLSGNPPGQAAVDAVAAVAPGRVNVVDGRTAFGAEYQASWPDAPQIRGSLRAQGQAGEGEGSTQQERDDMLAAAEVVVCGFPYPLDLRRRAPNLRWVHSVNAGASNFRQPFTGAQADVWGADGVTLTTSRGSNGNLPIAEFALASILMWAKGLPQGLRDAAAGQFSGREVYGSQLLQSKTVGIVGLGGIGAELAKLASGVGLRVIATRRTINPDAPLPEGVSELLPAAELPALLAQSDFVVLAVQWSPETEHLIGEPELRLMKPTATLINVARGEVVDTAALTVALRERRIASASLDVYEGEFDSLPPEELWSLPNVLITPHTSGGVEADVAADHVRGMELFKRNLGLFLAGAELVRPATFFCMWKRIFYRS